MYAAASRKTAVSKSLLPPALLVLILIMRMMEMMTKWRRWQRRSQGHYAIWMAVHKLAIMVCHNYLLLGNSDLMEPTTSEWSLMMLLVHLLLLSNMTSSSNSGSFWVEAAMPWGISFVWGSARFCVTESQKNKTIEVVQWFFVVVSNYIKVIQTKFWTRAL